MIGNDDDLNNMAEAMRFSHKRYLKGDAALTICCFFKSSRTLQFHRRSFVRALETFSVVRQGQRQQFGSSS
jgi:hypothetical protein